MAAPTVVIVGAGPAGIRAAEIIVRAGLIPTVVDENPQSGGQIYRRQPPGFSRPAKTIYGMEAGKAKQVQTSFDSIRDKIDYRPSTLAWNIYKTTLFTENEGVQGEVSFDSAIIAAGATDLVLPFAGWTRAGVFTLGGAQIALKYQACSVGQRTVFVGTGPLLYLVAYQYAKAGAEVAAVVDTTSFLTKASACWGLLANSSTFSKGLYYMWYLWSSGVPLYQGAIPRAVQGGAHVEGLVFSNSAGEVLTIESDAVAMGFGLRPETQIADLAHCEFFFDPECRQWLPVTDTDGRTGVSGLYLAGDSQRIVGAESAELSGALAAYAALEDMGCPVKKRHVAHLRRRLKRLTSFRRALDKAFPLPVELIKKVADDTIICRCEAITAGEIRYASTELGALEVNKAKAFTRIGMGRCQGRYCGQAGSELLADTLGLTLEAVSRLRGQAPIKPLAITPSN